MRVHDVEQGTEEWLAARLGIVTASEMQCILAQSKDRKGRDTYMRKLIGERITGMQASSYQSARMELGHMLEGDARAIYAESIDEPVVTVGFITNFDEIGTVGYSPDALVGDKGAAEIKSKDAHIQVEVLLRDVVPNEHYAQMQCGLWVAEREWIDFVSHSISMPMFKKRAYRDEPYIETMKKEVVAFYEELNEKLTRIMDIGVCHA